MATTTNTNKLEVTELDFDLIKSNLKAYLRGQDEFTDYDFDDSGLSVLLDILAYNTHYTGFYTNMIGNEMFLDSAIIRNSVVSRAKQLNYIPTSPQGSIATVDVSFSVVDTLSNLPSSISIPKGHIFKTTLNDKAYTFLSIESFTASVVSTSAVGDGSGNYARSFLASSVKIKEGVSTSVQYVVSNEGTDQKFIVPNEEADMTTLEVTVADTAAGTSFEPFTRVADSTSVSATDKVYWLQEGFDQKFEIYFGDGQVGYKPEPGNIVTMSYALTKATLGNGASVFSCNPIPVVDSVLTYPRTGTFDSVISTTIVESASGGSDRESISSIKFLAPLNYEAQGRSVTANDYKTRLVTDYPDIDAIRVWGGEENTPPDYGAVYIAIKPKVGFVLTNEEKNRIAKTILSPTNVVTIRPVIVDPEYLFLELSSIVKYDSRKTTITPSSMATLVSLNIQDYSDQNLEKFDSYFKYSNLLTSIDNIDSSISNNLLSVKMRVEFSPVVGTGGNYTINLANPIYHPHSTHEGSITSTTFTYFNNLGCSLRDLNGAMQVISSTGAVLNSNIGTVNYDTGVVSLVGFIPDEATTSIGIRGVPKNNDVIATASQILTINESDISIQLVDESSSYSTTLDPSYDGSQKY